MTIAQRIVNALYEGQHLTGKQISSRYGAANARAHIHYLRSEGYKINTKTHTDTKGRVTNKYSLASR